MLIGPDPCHPPSFFPFHKTGSFLCPLSICWASIFYFILSFIHLSTFQFAFVLTLLLTQSLYSSFPLLNSLSTQSYIKYFTLALSSILHRFYSATTPLSRAYIDLFHSRVYFQHIIIYTLHFLSFLHTLHFHSLFHIAYHRVYILKLLLFVDFISCLFSSH